MSSSDSTTVHSDNMFAANCGMRSATVRRSATFSRRRPVSWSCRRSSRTFLRRRDRLACSRLRSLFCLKRKERREERKREG